MIFLWLYEQTTEAFVRRVPAEHRDHATQIF